MTDVVEVQAVELRIVADEFAERSDESVGDARCSGVEVKARGSDLVPARVAFGQLEVCRVVENRTAASVDLKIGASRLRLKLKTFTQA